MSSPLAHDRRVRYREDTRRSILDAAEALLVEEGIDAFSMRRLARRCGCTAPTLYHYFRDKPGLIAALLEKRLQKLVTELRAVAMHDDAIANARSLCVAFARFGLRNPSHYQLLVMSRGADAVDPPSGEEARRLLGEPLEELLEREALTADELEVLRQGLWSLLHGMILLQTTRPEEDWRPGLLEASVDAIIQGMLRAARERREHTRRG